jgi:hypothetical protein
MAVFFASNVSTKAQCSDCPSWYGTYSFDYVVPGTSCTITVNYCQSCEPTGHTDVRLCEIVVPYGCSPFQLNHTFWMNVKIAAVEHAVATCSFGIPPCGGLPRQQYSLFTGECKHMVYDSVLGKITIEDCDIDPGICKSTFDACYNTSTGKYEITYNGDSVQDAGDCNPATPIVDENNEYIYCFTICN